jgi:hypothetical protein
VRIFFGRVVFSPSSSSSSSSTTTSSSSSPPACALSLAAFGCIRPAALASSRWTAKKTGTISFSCRYFSVPLELSRTHLQHKLFFEFQLPRRGKIDFHLLRGNKENVADTHTSLSLSYSFSLVRLLIGFFFSLVRVPLLFCFIDVRDDSGAPGAAGLPLVSRL